jgi:hypothetical protein
MGIGNQTCSLVFCVFTYQLLDVYAPEPLKLSCVVSPGTRTGKIEHSVQFGHQLFARSEECSPVEIIEYEELCQVVVEEIAIRRIAFRFWGDLSQIHLRVLRYGEELLAQFILIPLHPRPSMPENI